MLRVFLLSAVIILHTLFLSLSLSLFASLPLPVILLLFHCVLFWDKNPFHQRGFRCFHFFISSISISFFFFFFRAPPRAALSDRVEIVMRFLSLPQRRVVCNFTVICPVPAVTLAGSGDYLIYEIYLRLPSRRVRSFALFFSIR